MNVLTKITIWLIVGLTMTLSLGCDYNPERRQVFNKPRLLTDSTGGVWIVEHNLGKNYTLNRVPND